MHLPEGSSLAQRPVRAPAGAGRPASRHHHDGGESAASDGPGAAGATDGPGASGEPRGLQDLAGLDDELLVARAADGDDDAFAVLVHRHSSPLLALAQGLLGDRADAEEAVQDGLVGAWRRLPDFRGDATFRTWMYRIVTNRCLSVLRARRPTQSLDTIPEPATHDAAGQPARAAESAATKAALSGALRRLRADQRTCWILREIQGLSYGEMAHVVGTSEQTVRGRLFRARCNLMKEMESWR